jgi:muramoyltetrapeptide carboxypeptidase
MAVIAPSSPVDQNGLAAGLSLLESWEFRVRVYPAVHEGRGYLAGTSDQQRADDFVAAFADPEIAGVICASGGYGATRLLEKIDWSVPEANPKFFAGFSDITSLHLALNRVGLVTFHAPMVSAGIDRSAYNATCFRRALTSREPLGAIPLPDDSPSLTTLVGGVARGPLVGGNLTLIAATLGTPWEIDTRGKILVIEDVDEAPYRIDRMLTQLIQAGKLRDARGILFGDSPTCEKGPEGKPSLTLFEVLEDLLVPLGLPLIYGFPCGHSAYRTTLPLGVEAELDATERRLTIVEAALR